ncbi:MAG TPA: hypothetical protein VMT96_00065 [Candidatus Bathyarchaeia archaeon]|nr:hypothetical protein [Candidatus Bathyarchaeia archaeon]
MVKKKQKTKLLARIKKADQYLVIALASVVISPLVIFLQPPLLNSVPVLQYTVWVILLLAMLGLGALAVYLGIKGYRQNRNVLSLLIMLFTSIVGGLWVIFAIIELWTVFFEMLPL